MASFPPTRQFRRDEATKGRRDGNQEGEEQAPDGRPAPCAGSRPARAQVALADQARDGDSPLDDQARDREPPRGVDQDVLRTQVQPVRPPRRMPGPGDVRAPGLHPPVRRPRTALQGGLVPALRGGAPPPPRRTSATDARTSRGAACASSTTRTSSRTRGTAGRSWSPGRASTPPRAGSGPSTRTPVGPLPGLPRREPGRAGPGDRHGGGRQARQVRPADGHVREAGLHFRKAHAGEVRAARRRRVQLDVARARGRRVPHAVPRRPRGQRH